MKNVALIALGILMGHYAMADKKVTPTPELQAAVKKITDGKIIKVEEDHSGISPTYEIDIDSPNQAVRELEITHKDFELVEAEGRSLNDASFTPGSGLSSLSQLSSELKKYPDFVPHKWSLEKNMRNQWVYEVSGIQKGQEKEFKFNATDLALLKVGND